MAEFTAAEYTAYVKKYPDLVAAKPAGMSNAEWGKFHYETHGEKNMRPSPGVVAGNDADTLNKPDAAGYTPREYRDYVQKYPDLVAAKPAGMTDAEWGKKHWTEHGSKNPSRLTPTRAKTSEWWDQTTGATGEELGGLTGYSDDQYLNYVLANPDLRELSEALGLTQSETIKMGQQHWGTFGTDVGGQGENRAIGILNAAEHISNNSDFSAGSQAASEAYVQRITQNAPGSQMWDARTDISPDWRLNQFTGAGWNMAADQPYQTGILGDTLEVNPDIGQLVPTTAAGNVGDLRFVQDRYVDDAIANDFPIGWTTPQNTWADAAPGQLGAYWDVLTNAYRTPEGILRRDLDYDPATAVGPSVRPGPRGGGNIRTDPGRYIGGPATGGPPNPTVPSFGYPQYQDWTRFMPTNFQLAEGGGMHYQPGVTGVPQGYNTGGGLLTGGGGWTQPGFPSPGGGGGTPTGGPGPINPNIWGNPNTTSSSNTTTDTSGNQWVMSPGGQWYPATSDYGQGLLGNSRLFYDQHYDSSGAYVGAEGFDVRGDAAGGETNWASGKQTQAGDALMNLFANNPVRRAQDALNSLLTGMPTTLTHDEWVAGMGGTPTTSSEDSGFVNIDTPGIDYNDVM